jgi:hypothetical protein
MYFPMNPRCAIGALNLATASLCSGINVRALSMFNPCADLINSWHSIYIASQLIEQTGSNVANLTSS